MGLPEEGLSEVTVWAVAGGQGPKGSTLSSTQACLRIVPQVHLPVARRQTEEGGPVPLRALGRVGSSVFSPLACVFPCPSPLKIWGVEFLEAQKQRRCPTYF